MNNKVKFNICNCHYALQKISEAGELTFETPVAMPGAVSLALEPTGSRSLFTRTGLSITSLPTTWAMTGIWNWR